MKQFLLPETGNFYKVNMHCHTVLSDGSQKPEEVKRLFREMGYSAVAFTDHEIMLDHSDLNDDTFIALTSYEYGFDKNPKNPFPALYDGAPKSHEHVEKVHLNFYSKDPHDVRMVCCDLQYIWGNAAQFRSTASYVGAPDYQRKYTIDGVNEVIRAAKERNMFVVYNHPTWSMNTSRLYDALEGADALEIINGDGNSDSDMEDVPYVYQEMARAGKRIICVAGDDNHSVGGSGLAWTMIKAESLTYENLMNGLETGNCYASNGPAINELFVEDGKVTVRTSDAVGIYLHTAGRRTCHKSVKADGLPVTEATFPLAPSDLMFRISVRDKEGHHAYTRFYYFDELKETIG